MTVALERPVAVGDAMVAAVARNSISGMPLSGRIAVIAARRPLAILVARHGRVTAFSPGGDPMTRAQVEALCPGAFDALLSPGA